MAETETAPSKRQGRRLLILIAVGLVLLGAALFVRRYYLRFPLAGEGPAGPEVPRESFQKHWTTRKVLVLGLGDSITAGLGAPKDHAFFDRLVKNPEDEFPDMKGICLSAVFPNLEVENLSVSGTTSLQHMESQIPRIRQQPSDVLGVVILTTGGNDLIHPYGHGRPHEGAMYGATLEQARPWTQSFEKRLDEMISRIEACFPGGCHIFIGNIYDPTDGWGPAAVPTAPEWPDAIAILAAYNDTIARCAERHPTVHLVDIHTPFLGHGFRCDHFWYRHYDRKAPYFWYYLNVEDPNDRGHDAIRRLFLLSILKVLHTSAQ
ncbi:MAG TPA: SGNH/GDSL hydrolase family protein [Phycisphaerae bacterium]|nr:SGNH/GDSL hydrolase family protein [Phycisphaerae bacterium]